MATKRVFLLTTHNAFREALAEMLDEAPDFEVVAQVGSLAEVGDVELDHHNTLDITLVDPTLSDGDGVVVVRGLSKSRSNVTNTPAIEGPSAHFHAFSPLPQEIRLVSAENRYIGSDAHPRIGI